MAITYECPRCNQTGDITLLCPNCGAPLIQKEIQQNPTLETRILEEIQNFLRAYRYRFPAGLRPGLHPIEQQVRIALSAIHFQKEKD